MLASSLTKGPVWTGARPRVVDGSLAEGTARPETASKLSILHAMVAIGVDVVALGRPSAEAGDLVREIALGRLPIRAGFVAEDAEDVGAVLELGRGTGARFDVYTEEKLDATWPSLREAGHAVVLVVERAGERSAELRKALCDAAVRAGVHRVCLADDAGPGALVQEARASLDAAGGQKVDIEWRARHERGLSMGHTLDAIRAGARVVHGTASGLCDRSLEPPVEELVAEIAALGARPEVARGAKEAYRDLVARGLGLVAPKAPREPRVLFKADVNGEAVEVSTHPSRTLLELLRYDLDLIGTKQGCDEGDCGACTVLVDGGAVLSCITLAANCNGRRVETVESFSGSPATDPLLDAFDRTGAGQCGFCTPGMLMSAKGLLRHEPCPSRATIKEAISGNLCRCTGYLPIVEAIEIAAGTAKDVPPRPPLPGEEPLPRPLEPWKEPRR